MQGKSIVLLLAACLATMSVVWGLPGRPLAAGGGESPPFADADDDFLPDGVEWTMLTSSVDADTDGDLRSDFEELLQGSDPRQVDDALPLDFQMRLVISGPAATVQDPLVWMHVFFLLPGEAPSSVTAFTTWLEVSSLPGLRIPLDGLAPLAVSRERDVKGSKWVQFSLPLVDPTLILAIGDCTFCAQAMVGGRLIQSGMQLVPAQGEVLAVVPVRGDGRFVLQALSPTMAVDDGPSDPNRVCMLDLREVGAGPGGIQYQVVDAECEDANELECAATCHDSIGWIITIPGGTGLIGGN